MVERVKESIKLVLRVILLALHILLPFGLYFAMQAGVQALAVVTAALFGVSMLVLVWLG